MEEKIGGTIEEIKGKILNKPDLAEHGHLRKTGELQKREEEKKVRLFQASVDDTAAE